jgi:N-acetylmuramoyl-L-alanine amidase
MKKNKVLLFGICILVLLPTQVLAQGWRSRTWPTTPEFPPGIDLPVDPPEETPIDPPETPPAIPEDPPDKPVDPDPPSSYFVYTVKKGDTLYSIAQRNKTTVAAILVLNPDIEDPSVIRIGQQIKIPQSSSDPTPPDTPPTGTLSGWIITIDPGHGGSDPGAVNSALNLREKDINLQIGLKLRALLKNLGAQVEMTRETDISMDIPDRRTFSNNKGAHRLVSLHVNAASATAEGIETWVDRDSNSVWKAYARSLHNNTIASAKVYDPTIKDRGLKYSGSTPPWGNGRKIGVIRYDLVNHPATLIELNFISNDREATRLARNDYQLALAEGIANGFTEHAQTYRKEDGLRR